MLLSCFPKAVENTISPPPVQNQLAKSRDSLEGNRPSFPSPQQTPRCGAAEGRLVPTWGEKGTPRGQTRPGIDGRGTDTRRSLGGTTSFKEFQPPLGGTSGVRERAPLLRAAVTCPTARETPNRHPPARGAPRTIPYKALKRRPRPRPTPPASPADEVMRGSHWSGVAAPPEPERARSRL